MNITSALTFGFFGSAGRDGWSAFKQYGFMFLGALLTVTAPLLVILMMAKICDKPRRFRDYVLKVFYALFLPIVMMISFVGAYALSTIILMILSWLIFNDSSQLPTLMGHYWMNFVELFVNNCGMYIDTMADSLNFWNVRIGINMDQELMNHIVVANVPFMAIGTYIGITNWDKK